MNKMMQIATVGAAAFSAIGATPALAHAAGHAADPSHCDYAHVVSYDRVIKNEACTVTPSTAEYAGKIEGVEGQIYDALWTVKDGVPTSDADYAQTTLLSTDKNGTKIRKYVISFEGKILAIKTSNAVGDPTTVELFTPNKSIVALSCDSANSVNIANGTVSGCQAKPSFVNIAMTSAFAGNSRNICAGLVRELAKGKSLTAAYASPAQHDAKRQTVADLFRNVQAYAPAAPAPR